MNSRVTYQDSLQDRITEGVALMRVALDKRAPYLALATAREAARTALLALGQAPFRPASRELALLREVATATPHRFVGRPGDRQALVSATLDLLERLFPHPAAAGGGIVAPLATPARAATQRLGLRNPPGQEDHHATEHTA